MRSDTMVGPVPRAQQQSGRASVHCPMCTHSVPAEVDYIKKRMVVKPGQRCPRCAASLDVAAVLYLLHAA